MAYSDYLHCAVCDVKTLYDANCDYDAATGEYGQLYDIATICKECAKTHKIKIINEPTEDRVSEFLSC